MTGADQLTPPSTPSDPPSRISTNKAPLHGVRVIGLESFIAAPFASRLVADVGAEVIRIAESRRSRASSACSDPNVNELKGWQVHARRLTTIWMLTRQL
ncbi:hypothetical protein CH249_26530 [Rhodococcus sp. 05-2255-3B1]|uniref:CoA transferase n=1 Tax=Nocardiaceae TaxID=85025 RepID=UPI00056126FF|nr:MULTISPECIES: CoA transferase [Rhodococcus]OZE03926.1 hypothetical protein CH249_26530 [Rhodococcus sp. 05-2255-3B1]OZE09996.1 hypothetical protein CH250_13885 [Rhodococcus sp. 05-2255-3C]OZE15763.1 hypothetical protein CH255_20910 [Rhodococcus sp. 05-2255-2A2]